MADTPSIVVVGSVNLDIVATAARLPVAGETVTGATLSYFPGGKGANQALAARRLGGRVSLVARVGDDANAEAALALLRAGGVDISACETCASVATGVGLIAVGPDGENQIVVAPGANRELRPEMISLPPADAMICQLEIPMDTLSHAVDTFDGFICLNLAPAMALPADLPGRADLVVVNETEAGFYNDLLHELDCMVAKTLGAEGAELSRSGDRIAAARSPLVDVVDTTGAGDTFSAALTLAIVEGQELQQALEFACAAGAAATMKAGAQPSLPFRNEVEAIQGSNCG